MADKYYRLVCLVVNVCPEPLREFFLKLAKSDPSRLYIDLRAYLTLRHPQIAQLKRKKVIREDQYELIFPQNGNRTTDISAWDVTLLVTLIKNLFRAQPQEIYALHEIRDVRNELQHQPNTSTITDAEFGKYWIRLESATTFLARQVSGPTYETVINEKIKETRCNNMPNLGDTLRHFYEENIKRVNEETALKIAEMSAQIQNLQGTINALETKTDSVAINSSESNILLKKATVTKSGPNGETVKRFKTVDDIQSRLIKNLFATMITDLPDNFIPPTEIADIRTKLRDSHYVIIAGSRNSLNLSTALFVIKDNDYDHNRCVEMTSSSEWRHIDPEDVDLVLCRDPFGKPLYDARKASSMVDIFDSIYHAVRPRDGSKHLDFIIVTDVDCLTSLKETREHDLLEEVVLLSTTENHPVDLTTASYQSSKQSGYKVDFTRYMTSTILENYFKHIANIDHAKLEEATELLRKHRMVAIYGPAKSGKTSISVALANSYVPGEVLFIHSPDDIRSIDFQTTSLLVIDDFGGKYRFDWMEVNKWLACFDLLHEAVTAGKLKVVVTCETSMLRNCIKKVAREHPLLCYQLQLTKSKIHIKQERSENSITSIISRGRSLSNLQPGTSVDVHRDHVRSVQSVRQYSVRIDSDKMFCFITGCCMLPGGEILLVDEDNQRLKKLDSAYVISVCDLHGHPRGACYIGNKVAVVTVDKQLVYVDVSSMTVRNTVKTDHSYGSITCHNDKLYVMSRNTVYAYTLDGNNRSTLYKLNSRSRYLRIDDLIPVYNMKIAVSGDGDRIYVIDGKHCLITIDNCGKRLNSLSLPGGAACGVCVDDRDNVWVTMILKLGVSGNKLNQVSADGARLLGTVTLDKQDDSSIRVLSLCYDSERSSLILGGISDNMSIVRLN